MPRIWRNEVELDTVNAMSAKDMIGRLGFAYTAIGDDFLVATFMIDERTRQPMGLLHGGMSCAVSESMGSVAANLCVDRTRHACVGIELNASHLRGASEGQINARCTPIRVGRSTQVWQTDLYDDRERHLCVSRLTVAVIDRP